MRNHFNPRLHFQLNSSGRCKAVSPPHPPTHVKNASLACQNFSQSAPTTTAILNFDRVVAGRLLVTVDGGQWMMVDGGGC